MAGRGSHQETGRIFCVAGRKTVSRPEAQLVIQARAGYIPFVNFCYHAFLFCLDYPTLSQNRKHCLGKFVCHYGRKNKIGSLGSVVLYSISNCSSVCSLAVTLQQRDFLLLSRPVGNDPNFFKGEKGRHSV